MDLIQAIILAIVEGLTEFLPVSSTAHMIFTSTIFDTQKDEFVKMFQVSIQFGAILAVVVLYWKKFLDFRSPSFYLKLAIAVLPALILGGCGVQFFPGGTNYACRNGVLTFLEKLEIQGFRAERI